MSEDCIDLTLDDEEPTEINDQQNQYDDSFLPNNWENVKPKRTSLVNTCLSNSRTLSVIQSYRSHHSSFQLPTIVNVQSLAPQSNGRQSAKNVSPIKVGIKKNNLNKQLNKSMSTIRSIEDSIESCIRNNLPPDNEDNFNCQTFSSKLRNELTEGVREEKTVHKKVNLISCNAVTTNIAVAGTSGNTTAGYSGAHNQTVSSVERHIMPILEVSKTTLLFREFICKCVSLEESEKDQLRVKEKIRSYHEKASQEYKESEEFAILIKSQLDKVNFVNLYECIKEVLDKLKANRVGNRIELTQASADEVAGNNKIGNPSGFLIVKPLDPAKIKIVNKLSACLWKLNRKIKALEETEVDLDNEDDSAYLIMDRYRNRFSKIHKKLCEYTENSNHANRASKKKIRFNVTNYPEVNKAIERWLNKKGTFPDFSDVFQLLKTTSLNLKPDKLHHLAEEVFREIGKKLQNRRQLELWDLLGAYDSQGADPAAADSNLDDVLTRNRVIYKAKEEEIINLYVKKQLEGSDDAIAASNNSAEESEVSSEEKNSVNDNSQEEDMDEENNVPSSSSRTHDAEIAEEVVVEEENVHEYTVSRKRKMADDKTVGSTKRLTLEPIIERPSKNELSQSKHKVPAKPFGTVGQVIELNYVSVQNLNNNVMCSIFKDSTNTFHARSKSYNSVITEISEKYKLSLNSSDLSSFPIKPLLRSESCLTKPNLRYKCHGAVGYGASSKENVSNNKENSSSSENQSEDKSTSNDGGMTGSGGYGDDDKDENKNHDKKIENEPMEEEDKEEVEDGDCEQDAPIDPSAMLECVIDHPGDSSQGEGSLGATKDDNPNDNITLLQDTEIDENKIESDTEMNELGKDTPLNGNRETDETLNLEKDSGCHADCSEMEIETAVEGSSPNAIDTSQSMDESKVNDNAIIENQLDTDVRLQEISSTDECPEKETDQQSSTSTKYQKPAWIDNGEESDNDSDKAFKEADERAASPCLSENTSTNNSAIGEEQNDIILPKKTIKRRPKLDRKAKSVGSIAKPQENELKNNDREIKKKKIAARGTSIKGITKMNEDKNNDIEVISETIVKKPVVISEEERVKRFLEAAKDSVSITVTRTKGMSRETIDALDHLKKLKNISATRLARPAFGREHMMQGNQAGPSRMNQISHSSPRFGTPHPARGQLPYNNRFNRPSFSPTSRFPISNIRGRRGNGRYQDYRGRDGLPVISSVQSYNVRTPIIMSVRGRGTPVRMNNTPIRGFHQPTSRPNHPSSSSGIRARGRGTVRGHTRIVPVVVLD